MLLAAGVFGATSLQQAGANLARLLESAPFEPPSGAVLLPLSLALGLVLTPWILLPMAFALLSILGQRSFTVTGTKLKPKISRISILSNAKQKFGGAGLFEFAKSTAKLVIYSVALFVFLAQSMPSILSLVLVEPAIGTARALSMTVQFMSIVLIVALAIGFVDLLFQQAEHLRKHRMSRKELMDEHKDSEGDPHMKQQRRQKGMEIASNKMLQDVPDASVVLVNPTHYAVALKWSRSNPGAPVCVAKGVDVVAARIREVAIEAGVPIHPDPPTTRAIYGAVEIGHEIRPEHYAAVAVAIRFSEDMRRKAKAR